MIYILSIFSSFSGGVLVGGAYAAFITLVKVFPRLLQFTATKKYYKGYEYIFIISTLIFTVAYFSDLYLKLRSIMIIIIGLFFGIFLGVFSSALAETLNVLPAISKKFKIKKQMKVIFYALTLGKVFGALYYFIIFNGG